MGDEGPVHAAGDRMNASKNFRNIKTSFNIRETRDGKEVSFTISFQYVGHD